MCWPHTKKKKTMAAQLNTRIRKRLKMRVGEKERDEAIMRIKKEAVYKSGEEDWKEKKVSYVCAKSCSLGGLMVVRSG